MSTSDEQMKSGTQDPELSAPALPELHTSVGHCGLWFLPQKSIQPPDPIPQADGTP